MRTLFSLACGIFISSAVLAQGWQSPQLPQPPTFPQYGSFGEPTIRSSISNNIPSQYNATFTDPFEQSKNSAQAAHAPISERTRQTNEALMQEIWETDPSINPSLLKGDSRYAINRNRELMAFMQLSIDIDNLRRAQQGTSIPGTESNKPFVAALQVLQEMLSGKRKLSIADAYYTIENAYGEAYLSPQEYKATIRQSADFIRQWMQEHKMNIKDNAQVNYAIQQFMSQKLSVSQNKKQKDGSNVLQSVTHIPFFYDYVDYKGIQDHRNYFLTKCLATGSGQCNSLPAVYLVLAEALGATAYLSVAPNHALIKYPDSKGNIRNYEPTSNWDISDQWYQEHFFISQEAMKRGTYLAPFSKKQIIADAAVQLAFGYVAKIGAGNEAFIKDCLTTAQQQFPGNNHLGIYFTYSSVYAYQLAQAMKNNRISRLNEVGRSPQTQQAYERWQKNEQIITALGFQNKPQYVYEQMMQSQEFKGKRQQERDVNGKEKRSLFIQSN